MENQLEISKSNVVYLLRLHIVFVTKYRRQVITGEMLVFLEAAFRSILDSWQCRLEEFGGDADHVHLLISIHPALDISKLINNLKSATSKKVRSHFPEQVAKFYWKPYFWHRAYYVGSVGMVSLETIRRYIEQQSTVEKDKTAR